MKKMVKMLATFAVMFVAVSTVAKAQGGGGGRGGRGGANFAVILKDSLHVSADVATKADSIAAAYQKKNADLRASGGDMQAMMPKMQELRTQQMNDMKALLNADQKAAFDKIVAAMPTGRRGGGR